MKIKKTNRSAIIFSVLGVALVTITYPRLADVSWAQPLPKTWSQANAIDQTNMKGSFDAGAFRCAGAPIDCVGSASALLGKEALSIVADFSPSARNSECSTEKHKYFAIGQKYGIQHLAGMMNRRSFYSANSLAGNPGMPQRLFLPKGPSWILTAIWDLGESAIIASDVNSHSIFHFSVKDGIVRQVFTSSTQTQKEFAPSRLQRVEGGYIVENAEGELIWLDENYAVKREEHLIDIADQSSFMAKSINSWVKIGDGIIALGDRKRSEHDWSSALMRFPLPNPSTFETIETFELTGKSKQYARLGFPILAATRNKAYVLLMEGAPGIYEIGSGLRRLQVFPENYETFPDVGTKINETTGPQIYLSLEKSQMPVALYGKGDFLYLLLRKPDASSSGTTWLLAKIDPVKEVIVHSVKLPINAKHVVLVPGENTWAAIEKGPVEAMGKQKVNSIALIPASWPEEATWSKPQRVGT